MKRLIVCADGTWGTSDTDTPTNVVKLAGLVLPQAGAVRQVVLYDPGVGTGGLFDKLIGGATGLGISKNIKDAYRFLIEFHEDPDEIYLFGFSRGAYTVRSTAGLIRKCGLLRKAEVHRIPDAYRIYRTYREADKDSPDTEEANAFRKNYSRDVRIKFIGVWDTVGSLGIPGGLMRALTKRLYHFHNVQLSRSVDFAYHAVAIDERRKPFEPTLWKQHEEAPPSQVLEQAWFTGAHSDVGGGLHNSSLSDIALTWLMQKAQGAGVVFRSAASAPGNPLGRIHDSGHVLFGVLGSLSRPIGEREFPQQCVHSAAVQRFDAIPLYRPPNLSRYLGTNQPPQICA